MPRAWYTMNAGLWIAYEGRQAVWEDYTPGPCIAKLIERGHRREDIEWRGMSILFIR